MISLWGKIATELNSLMCVFCLGVFANEACVRENGSDMEFNEFQATKSKTQVGG